MSERFSLRYLRTDWANNAPRSVRFLSLYFLRLHWLRLALIYFSALEIQTNNSFRGFKRIDSFFNLADELRAETVDPAQYAYG